MKNPISIVKIIMLFNKCAETTVLSKYLVGFHLLN